MTNFSFKIKTSIMAVFAIVVVFISGTIIYFQYKSSNEFALLTTQKVFNRISDKVINQIQTYDRSSREFINLAKNIKDIDEKISISTNHTVLPIIIQYIKNSNYVYGIYMGYGDDSFYIVYNLDLSAKMKEAQNAPTHARWLIKKNIKENGEFISHKVFIDKDMNTILVQEESTTYKPTQRPWYKDAIVNDKMIKTNPYIFSSIQEPGITYSQIVNKEKGVIISLDITLNSLSKLLQEQKLVDGSASFIFNEDGKIIGQSDSISNKEIKNLNNSYKDIFIKNNKVIDLEQQKIITINGKEYLKYTTLLKSSFYTKDYLTIVSPVKPIMKPYKDKIMQTLGFTLLILLLVVLPIVFYAVRLIVKPILRLQEQNKKIENGDLEDVEEIDSFMIEIADLSHSLVSMANSIQEKTKSIKNLNENLELKVKVRTKDLENTKKEVEQILASILSPVLITDKESRKITYANQYAQIQYDTSLDKMIGSGIEDLYTAQGQSDELVRQMQTQGFIKNLEQDFQTHSGKSFTALLSVIPIKYKNRDSYIGMTADITKQKETERTVKNLLNNAGQGFLYFNKEMIIGKEYSLEAKNIFSEEIDGKNITELLVEDQNDRMFFQATLQSILGENEMKQDILISLLQKEFNIDDRFIEVQYKVLNEENFMMILTDITAQKNLTQKVKDEQQVLKMVVETVTTLEQFLEVKQDYEQFINKIEEFKQLDKLSDLRKEIHTYKGLFAQKEMLNVVKSLHDFESIIDASLKKEIIDKDIINTTTENMYSWLEKDIDILQNVLGDNIFSKSNNIAIDKDRIKQIEYKLKKILNKKTIQKHNKIHNGVEDILVDIKKLTFHNIETYLKPYEKLVEQLALKLDKYINPLQLSCDEIYISEQFRPFLNSIVHIFRNSVDHGIESLDDRYENEKDEYGTIKCIATQDENSLKVSISDDGAGVDIEKIKSIAVKKDIYTQEEVEKLTNEEVVLIIFKDAFSTSEAITDVSGRGVGLASILTELNKLNGVMNVINNFGQGIEFRFEIPLKGEI